jgi:ATP-dependent exoDNAse (exonuclease V) beta subunit
LYEDKDGEYHLIDYKTDRLTPEERADRTLARQKMYDKHSLQLSYYAKAVELMFGKYPKTIEVYSLPLGDTLDVKNDKEK